MKADDGPRVPKWRSIHLRPSDREEANRLPVLAQAEQRFDPQSLGAARLQVEHGMGLALRGRRRGITVLAEDPALPIPRDSFPQTAPTQTLPRNHASGPGARDE